MGRIYFARGCRGAIPKRLQACLAAGGFYTGAVDGIYGGGTERAVRAFQASQRLEQTGAVDEATWIGATQSPIPSLAERCLQLTAAFEGHGFSIVQGNFDGAWLTWGIIGFTLKHGEIQRLVLRAWEADPNTVRAAFGERVSELVQLVARNNPRELERWANSVSSGASKASVIEPWRSGFMKLGESPLVQQLQIQRAMDAYFSPCLATAERYNLTSELGIALCFDVHVQNGGVRPTAHHAIVKAIGMDFSKQPEAARREALARAVAAQSAARWRADVLSRKLAFAQGEGKVHGEFFDLANWGLGDYRSTRLRRDAQSRQI